MSFLREFRPGEVLRADALEDMRREIVRLGTISTVAPLTHVSDSSGIGLRYNDGGGSIYIKLTSGGTGGKYAWTLQVEQTGGTWANDPSGQSGTTANDPAIEMNLSTSVSLSPNPVVRAWRDSTGALRFQADC